MRYRIFEYQRFKGSRGWRFVVYDTARLLVLVDTPERSLADRLVRALNDSKAMA